MLQLSKCNLLITFLSTDILWDRDEKMYCEPVLGRVSQQFGWDLQLYRSYNCIHGILFKDGARLPALYLINRNRQLINKETVVVFSHANNTLGLDSRHK